jgi:hypothetical protein
MAIYRDTNTRYVGTIDIETATIVPQFTLRTGALDDGYFRTDKGESFSFQLFSDDISASLTWTLQYSLDGTNWATAKDSSDTDITGTLVADTATIQSVYAPRYVYFRVSLAVTTETGNVSYIVRPGNSEK